MSSQLRPDVTTTRVGVGTATTGAQRPADGRDDAAPADPTHAAQAEVQVRWGSGVLAVIVLGAAIVTASLLTHEPASPGTVVAVGGGFATVLVADDPRVDPGATVHLEDAVGATVATTVDASSEDPATEGVTLVLRSDELSQLALEEAPVVDVTFPARSVARSLVGR